MSININDPELHQKMAQVDEPFDVQKAAGFFAEKTGQWSIAGAREEYKAFLKRIEEEKDPMERAWLLENRSTGIVIYGMGGWHRYFVRSNGNVVYSERHGTSDVERARKVGFDIQ